MKMVEGQLDRQKSNDMSAFAARRVKRSRALKNLSADAANGDNNSRKTQPHQVGDGEHGALPHAKRQKRETEAQTSINPASQPSPPASLPPTVKEGGSVTAQNNVQPAAVNSNPVDDEHGFLRDETQSILTDNTQDEAPDTDYSADADE